MVSGDRHSNLEGFQAFQLNNAYDLVNGNSVKSGASVSINSGTLGQSDTLSVASGTVLVDADEKSVSSGNVQIDSADSNNPRKDLVYADTNGNLQVSKGTPAPAEPSDESNFTTYNPSPNDLSGTDAAILAEVYVPAGASSISASNLRDRRVFADFVAGTLNFFSDADANSNKIINLTDPSNAQDAATKNYVDSEVTDSQIDVQDDGSSVLADAETINFKGGHFDATDDGSSVAGIDITSGSLENSLLVNSSVTFAGQTASLGGSASISIDNLSDVASSTESAGQLPIWNATNNQYENAVLTGGNAINVANADASVTLSVPTDGIGTDELDQAANYDFSSAISFTGGIDGSGSNVVFNDNIELNTSQFNDLLGCNSIRDWTGGVARIDFGTGDDSQIFSLRRESDSTQMLTIDPSVPEINAQVALNMSNSNAIQVAGVDMIVPDGTGKINIAQGLSATLEANNNRINTVDVLQFDTGNKRISSGGGGSGSIQLRDTAASVNKFRMNENGRVESLNVGIDVNSNTTQPGSSSTPALGIGNAGAGFFVNSSGEVVVVDEAGNTTIIS